MRLQQRGGQRRHRRLAVRADDVDRGEPALGHAPAAPSSRWMRSRPKRQPIGSQRAQRQPPQGSAQLLELRPVAVELRRSASTTSAGALATKPSLAELALAALDLRAQLVPPLLDPPADLVRSRPRPSPGSRARRSWPGPRRSAPSRLSRARRRDQLVRRARRRRRAPGRTLPAGDPDQVAPAADAAGQLDRGPASRASAASSTSAGSASGKPETTSGPALGAGQVTPDLLGHERHHRVGQRQHPLEDEEEVLRDLALAVVQARLDDLEVPVAELRPEEVVEVERGMGEVVARRASRVHRRRSSAAAARGSSGPRTRRVRPGPGSASRVQQDQARGVPHLVGEVAALLDAVGRVAHVLASRTSPAGRSAARRRRGRRSRPAGRSRCPATSTSAGRRAPGSRSARRRRRNGMSPANSRPIITIRATQRKMISRAVVRKLGRVEGRQQRVVRSGQPSVANGHSAELNQVSSTSVSCRSAPGSIRRTAAAARGRLASESATTSSPSSQYQTGIWWPHQSWRETHQGRMFSHPVEVHALPVLGTDPHLVAPRPPRSPARPARPCGRTTGARSAARSARRSARRTGPSACTAPRRGAGPARAGRATTASCASATVIPAKPRRRPRSFARPRRSPRPPRGRARGRSRSR